MWQQTVVPSNVPQDFGPVTAFGAKIKVPVTKAARERDAGPLSICDKFLSQHSLQFVKTNHFYQYIKAHQLFFPSESVSFYGRHLQTAQVLFTNTESNVVKDQSSGFNFHNVGAGAY